MVTDGRFFSEARVIKRKESEMMKQRMARATRIPSVVRIVSVRFIWIFLEVSFLGDS